MNQKTGFFSFPSKPAALLLASLLPCFSAFAEQNQEPVSASSDTVLSNPVFIILLCVFILFFILILVLANVVSNVALGIKPAIKKPGSLAPLILILLAFIPARISAETTTEVIVNAGAYGGLSAAVFWGMVGAIGFECVIVAVLLIIIGNLTETERITRLSQQKTADELSLIDKLNASVSLDKEGDILLDHNYDGIRELDNDLPPWWKYGFYLSIVFAFVYLIHFHITKTGDLPLAEYKNEQKEAENEQAELRKNAKNLIDEHSVTALTDAASLEEGKNLFIANCAACHLPDGGGIVGPNLTDDYWLHGGKINDIFKTIKYGYQEKGMKPWKDDFSPLQIAMLASYIKSLKGTHPANPKEPQGELYKESDSKTAPADSVSSGRVTGSH